MKSGKIKRALEKSVGIGEIMEGIVHGHRFTMAAVFTLSLLAFFFRFVLGVGIDYVPVVTLFLAWMAAALGFRVVFEKIAEQRAKESLLKAYFAYSILRLALASFLLHYLGGIEWLGFIFFFFVILYAVFILPAAKSLAVTVAAAILFIAVSVLEYFSVIERHFFFEEAQSVVYDSWSHFIVTLTIVVMSFFLINRSIRVFSHFLSIRSGELSLARKLEGRLKETLKELKGLKDFAEEMIRNVPDGIVFIDRRGVITFANDTARKIVGAEDAGPLEGKNIDSFLFAKKNRLKKYFRAVIEKGEPFDLEEAGYISGIGGKEMVLRLSGQPIGESGNVKGMLVSMEDVNVEDDLKFKLREHARELEKKVQERTSELKGKVEELEESRMAAMNILEDLRAVYEKLKEIDEMKSEFIRVVSHQLRTPMSSMRWHLEMVMNGDMGEIATEEQEKSLDYVYQNTQEMINVLEHMLLAMEIEEDKVYMRTESVQTEDLIREVVKEYANRANFKGIEIEFENLVHYLPEVEIDRRKIKYVLVVLVNNAIRYTGEGGKIGIYLQKAMLPDGQEGVSIVISDTGIGIPEKDIGKVFSKFYRGKKAVKYSPGGIGLGLFITKSFVDKHNGKISVESEEGNGATFTIVLPYVHKDTKGKNKDSKGSSKKAERINDGGLKGEVKALSKPENKSDKKKK